MRIVLATLIALALLPASAAAQEPAVTTGPAEAVGPATATLTGTVDPEGAATAYRFEYGTTDAYGIQTPEQEIGDGDEPVAVQAALRNLTPSTTYHYRLVAGGVTGADRTFKTATAPPAPARPRISRMRIAEKTATSARLTALIDPNRAATTYLVEWGTSASLGSSTPAQTLPAGTDPVAVSFALDGLPAFRRIQWRVVATNSAGVKRSGRKTFTTARALTGVTLNVFPALATWSGTVALGGRVEGAGVHGVDVALQQSSFPFAAGYHDVALARSNRHGAFHFPARPVFLATRFRAVAHGSVVSPELATRVRSRVTLRASHRKRRSLRLSGGVNPGLPSGRAILQKRTRAGGWRRVARRALVADTELRSSYAFDVRRQRRAKRYRVVVAARDGGAHARGYSRSLRVGKRR